MSERSSRGWGGRNVIGRLSLDFKGFVPVREKERERGKLIYSMAG